MAGCRSEARRFSSTEDNWRLLQNPLRRRRRAALQCANICFFHKWRAARRCRRSHGVVLQELHCLAIHRLHEEKSTVSARCVPTSNPVAGARDEHFADQEKVVDGVEGVDCAAPAYGNGGSTDLALQEPAVGHGNIAGAVNQRF